MLSTVNRFMGHNGKHRLSLQYIEAAERPTVNSTIEINGCWENGELHGKHIHVSYCGLGSTQSYTLKGEWANNIPINGILQSNFGKLVYNNIEIYPISQYQTLRHTGEGFDYTKFYKFIDATWQKRENVVESGDFYIFIKRTMMHPDQCPVAVTIHHLMTGEIYPIKTIKRVDGGDDICNITYEFCVKNKLNFIPFKVGSFVVKLQTFSDLFNTSSEFECFDVENSFGTSTSISCTINKKLHENCKLDTVQIIPRNFKGKCIIKGPMQYISNVWYFDGIMSVHLEPEETKEPEETYQVLCHGSKVSVGHLISQITLNESKNEDLLNRIKLLHSRGIIFEPYGIQGHLYLVKKVIQLNKSQNKSTFNFIDNIVKKYQTIIETDKDTDNLHKKLETNVSFIDRLYQSNDINCIKHYCLSFDLFPILPVGSQNMNILHWACMFNNASIVEWMIEISKSDFGHYLESKDDFGNTPLVVAVEKDYVEVIKPMAKYINASTELGYYTYSQWYIEDLAIINDSVKCLPILIDFEYDWCNKKRHGFDSITLAIESLVIYISTLYIDYDIILLCIGKSWKILDWIADENYEIDMQAKHSMGAISVGEYLYSEVNNIKSNSLNFYKKYLEN